MRRLLAITALAAVTALSLTGCLFRPPVSMGPLVTEQRDVEEVSAVTLTTSGDLVVTVGEPSLTITAPEDVMDRLTSESGDDLLVLSSTGPGMMASGIRYELSMPSLSAVRLLGSGDVDVDFSTAESVHVSVDGSGDVEGTGIAASTVAVTVNGSGDVELVGTADGVRVSLDGSGDIDLEDLVVLDGFVDVAGSGDVGVHATRSLSIEISGSGNVRYSGGAEVTTDISGSGEATAD